MGNTATKNLPGKVMFDDKLGQYIPPPYYSLIFKCLMTPNTTCDSCMIDWGMTYLQLYLPTTTIFILNALFTLFTQQARMTTNTSDED